MMSPMAGTFVLANKNGSIAIDEHHIPRLVAALAYAWNGKLLAIDDGDGDVRDVIDSAHDEIISGIGASAQS
jgi:hypothetical protein